MQDVAALQTQVAALLARVAELEAEVERLRRKGYKPQANRQSPPKTKRQDRRTKRHRQHPGVFREPPKLDELPPDQVQRHDVRLEQCPCCGSQQLQATGEFEGKPRGHTALKTSRMVDALSRPKPYSKNLLSAC
ncbi:MAG: hypothetical protein K8T91_02245 [Planctomycetes bacterium]|nr:hypothetical protein [Planctomycetota bacterium]